MSGIQILYGIAVSKYIPLTNRVRGPLRFMARALRAWAINQRGKKQGSVTYSTDRENEVSKIFIISLPCV